MSKKPDICDVPPYKSLSREAQAFPCTEPMQDPCAPAHNEFICHAMGEKRQHLLKEVKKILDKMDTSECPPGLSDKLGYSQGVAEHSRPMMKYPGYIDLDSPKFKQTFFTPLITNVQVQESRPTATLSKYQHENSPTLKYVQIEERACQPWALPRKKSFELRGGILFKGCDCSKHNGLQDRCERTDCGEPECLSKPDPSCQPSKSFVSPPPQRPINDMVREIVTEPKAANKTYCCCSTSAGDTYKNIQGKKYKDCNHKEGPGAFECFKCRD